VYVLNLPLR